MTARLAFSGLASTGLACLAALLLIGAGGLQQRVPAVAAEIVRIYPHDSNAFTEGLFFQDDYLYESTGQVGHSSIRKVALETGKFVREVIVPAPYFGEGIVAWGKQIISLTWQHQTGFRWTLDWLSNLDRDALPAVREGEESLRKEYEKALRESDVSDHPSVGALLKAQMASIDGEIRRLPTD